MKSNFNKLFTLLTILTLGITNVWGAPQSVTFGTAVGTKGRVYSSSTVADNTILADKCVYYSSAKNTVSLSSSKIIAYRLSLIFHLNAPAQVDAVIGKNKDKPVTYVLYSMSATQYNFIKGMAGESSDVATAYVALDASDPMKTLFKDASISNNDASRQKLLSAVDVADVTTKLYTSGSYTTSTSEVTTIPIWVSGTGDSKNILPAGYYAIYMDCGSSSGNTLDNLTFTATAVTKHTVTYNLNGGTGTLPTQADVAEGSKFTLHNGTTDITAPTGQKFDGWHDGTSKYAGGAEYTMGTSNVTLTAQWVENVPDPTASFADATYIIGQSALDMSAKFTSNSSGSVTYSLKEATSDASITSAGSFTATVAGTYVVVASQEAVAGTYAAISKEATVTVLDSEVADTYIWKKGTGYTGCVASPNADAPAAQYTDIAYEGFTGMGRAAADNTECILTFTVKAAYSATFGIKSICTYGKLEEPAGGQISWDGGTSWENLAAYSEGKKEFTAPAATFPTSFKIRFLGVSASSGGLYWRNALVTLEMKKTVSSVTETLTNVKVNDVAISAANLATLQADKTLDIATSYATAPTVTFVKQVTTSYDGGWADDVTNVDVEVAASDITTAWSASATINAQTYTVTLAKPAGPSLETEATAFTLTSAKVATDTKSFTFSGVNLTSGNVTISLESPVAGMTVSPSEVTPTAGAITDQEVTITYKSLEDVAAANVNLVVYYDADTKITIPLTYSSTVGYENLTSISAATTWNWNGAASAAVGTVVDKAQMIILANADVTWDEGFNARAIAGKLEYMCRDNKYAQGDELMFNTTIPGKVYVTYSNTGGNDPRTVNVNGTKGSLSSSNNKDADKRTESFAVSAGDVLIKGVQVSDDAAKYLRYYEVRFVPVFAVTYDAGEGSVKGGETMPTQADEAAGEKIILAAATALEKDGYDFAGWLCNIDAQTYQPGDEYEMTAAATTFTAQWVLHVDPVDPTLTYDEGAYMTGGAALDLSTLITASTSTGAITYSVKDAGTTGATIDGKNFTATAAGTATITASQAAVLGFNAITVDFEVVVTEATEIDGIKMVEAGALTGNFRVKADQLKTGDNTVEGINYTKYVQMGSTHTSFSGEIEGTQAKGIYYAPAKKNIKFWFYMRNTDSSARKIYIYKMEEGSAVSSETVSVDAGSHLVSYDMTLSTNAEVIFGVENTKLCFCQIVAVESGDDLLQGGQNGYVFDYSKKRQNVAKETLRTIDGIDYYLYADSKINSSTNVQLNTLGTHYIKFHLNSPMTVKVSIDGTKQYYIGTECSTDDAAKEFSATETAEFSLTAGDWYINAAVQVKVTKLEFTAPKCAEPVIDAQPASQLDFAAGDMTASVTAHATDGGTLSYQWYKAADDSEVTGQTTETLTTTEEGTYYVIITNTLADHSDNFVKSDNATLKYRKADDATLSSLVPSTGTLEPAFDPEVLEYNVNLPEGTVDVPTLTATAAMAAYGATADVTNATAFVNYEATSTVLVTAEDHSTQQTYTVHFYVDHTILALVDVTGDMTWDFSKAQGGTTATSNMCEDAILANVAGIVNDANFKSDNIMATANKFSSGKLQASMIKFHTTVDGLIKVVFSHTGNNKTDGRALVVNGTHQSELSHNQTAITYYCFVPAGDVVLTATTGDGGSMLNFTSVQFTAKAAADLARDEAHGDDWMAPGELGTVCIPNGAVATGGDLYTLEGKNSDGKIVFATVPNNKMTPGVPYLFQATSNAMNFFYTDEDVAGAPDNSGAMKSTFEDNVVLSGDDLNGVYYFNGHALWNAAALTELPVVKYRAYVKMDEVSEIGGGASGAPGRRYIIMDVHGQNATTGFGEVQGDDVQCTKMLINGQIFILRGEKMYDTTGRLVK